MRNRAAETVRAATAAAPIAPSPCPAKATATMAAAGSSHTDAAPARSGAGSGGAVVSVGAVVVGPGPAVTPTILPHQDRLDIHRHRVGRDRKIRGCGRCHGRRRFQRFFTSGVRTGSGILHPSEPAMTRGGWRTPPGQNLRTVNGRVMLIHDEPDGSSFPAPYDPRTQVFTCRICGFRRSARQVTPRCQEPTCAGLMDFDGERSFRCRLNPAHTTVL